MEVTCGIPEYDAVLRRDPCAYCGESGGTLDHIRAKSRGGTHVWWNLTGACAECNCRKSNERLLLFLMNRQLGFPAGTYGRSKHRLKREERERRKWSKKHNWEHRLPYTGGKGAVA